MRASLSPIATTIVAFLIVAACELAPSLAPVTPSSSPSGSQAPSTPSPTLRPSPSPVAVSPAMGRIAAGYEHTCVLTSGDGVRCWGSNASGQLGNGTTSDSRVPVDVPALASGVSAIAAGGSHTCALTTAGGVKCWGYNAYGQLGNGATTDSNVPVDVVGLASGVAAISVGWSSTCAVTTAGGLKCWGHNFYGWLGDGTTTDRSTPVEVQGLDSRVTAVAVGVLHTCALASSGAVACWGYGQAADPDDVQTVVPVDVPGLASGVVAISAGLDRTCALAIGGGVTCWGPHYRYSPDVEQAPNGVVSVDVSGVAGGVTAIVAGEGHSCALTGAGDAACWGNDGDGQLGRGITSPDPLPVPLEIAGLDGGVTSIAVGGTHTCALASSGGVSCWGSNTHGQLGSVMRCSSSSVPVRVVLDGAAASPPPGSVPTGLPAGRIEHSTGSTDVILRYDIGPDLGVSDLTGEFFQPGPGFSLYGDGMVIFRDERAGLPPADGPIVRASPFKTARLDDDRMQSLLRFALGEGGLATACDRYESQDTDVAESHILTIHAGGFDKRVDAGASPLGPLMDELRTFDPGSAIPTSIWAPNRYWGNLLPAEAWIEEGFLPASSEAGSVPWPWPGIAPGEFVGLDPTEGRRPGRRIMTADEAAVLGLSNNGGVVQRIYLVGPDGATIYSFSLWPMQPDGAS